MKFPKFIIFLLFASVESAARDVSSVQDLREALAGVASGETIRLAPGVYKGSFSARGLRGEPGKPIVLRAADPGNPPVIEGGGACLQLSAVAHIEIHNIVMIGASGNGLNIDDGGSGGEPSHDILLRGLRVRDIGPRGNHDGIKLSGVERFRVENCVVERWGSGGSGIDMVGCRDGVIIDCRFKHGDAIGDSGVQAKGGSASIEIRRCLFEHAGQRAINIGGSTGLEYFRPRPAGFEAKDILVEDCTFDGSMSPIAFVGSAGAIVRHNTIHRPKKWGFRILQETRAPGFLPCKDGLVSKNLIVFRSDEMTVAVNVGDATSPETFRFSENAWYCIDAPARSRPRLPVAEVDGLYGRAPNFRNAQEGDFGRTRDDGLGDVGVRSLKE